MEGLCPRRDGERGCTSVTERRRLLRAIALGVALRLW